LFLGRRQRARGTSPDGNAAELRLRALGPERCAEVVEDRPCALERRLRQLPLAPPPLHLPECEERAREVERHVDTVVLGQRLVERGGGRIEILLRSREEPPRGCGECRERRPVAGPGALLE